MFSEAVIIEAHFVSDDDQCNARVVNTKALLHAIFKRSELVGNHYKSIVQVQSANDWEGYGAFKADSGKSTLTRCQKTGPPS